MIWIGLRIWNKAFIYIKHIYIAIINSLLILSIPIFLKQTWSNNFKFSLGKFISIGQCCCCYCYSWCTSCSSHFLSHYLSIRGFPIHSTLKQIVSKTIQKLKIQICKCIYFIYIYLLYLFIFCMFIAHWATWYSLHPFATRH